MGRRFVGGARRDRGPAGAKGAPVSPATGSRDRDCGDARWRQRPQGHLSLGPAAEAGGAGAVRHRPRQGALPRDLPLHLPVARHRRRRPEPGLGRFATAGAEPGHISIDGETLRGSRRPNARAIHVLAAFSTGLGAVIGDLLVEPDQKEIAAAMSLLKQLPLDGAVITGNPWQARRGDGPPDHQPAAGRGRSATPAVTGPSPSGHREPPAPCARRVDGRGPLPRPRRRPRPCQRAQRDPRPDRAPRPAAP